RERVAVEHSVTVSPASSGGRPLRSAADGPAAKPAKRPRADRSRLYVLAALSAPLVAINIAGARYYLAPVAERVRDPLHPWLRPSGYVGQSAGILALVIFIFLWLYPLRKKWKA